MVGTFLKPCYPAISSCIACPESWLEKCIDAFVTANWRQQLTPHALCLIFQHDKGRFDAGQEHDLTGLLLSNSGKTSGGWHCKNYHVSRHTYVRNINLINPFQNCKEKFMHASSERTFDSCSISGNLLIQKYFTSFLLFLFIPLSHRRRERRGTGSGIWYPP
jgi:hypothetical protein